MRIRPFSRPGAALHIAAAAVALAGLVGAGIAGYRSARSTAPARTVSVFDPEPLTNQELAIALTRAGLDAPALAAAGLSDTEATNLVDRARAHLAQNIQDLRDADSSYVSSKTTADQLQRLIQSGKSSQEDRTAYTAALSSLASATASRQAALDQLFAAAANTGVQGGLTVAQASTLGTIHANLAWGLPTQYLVLSRSQPDWVNLREALANDRISDARGEEPDPSAQQLLLNANTHPATSAAASNLNNLGQVHAAWSTAVGQ